MLRYSKLLVWFGLVRDKTIKKIGYKNLRPFCSYFRLMPERLFTITESNDCIF
jgi:hypothetical protein